VLGQVDVAEAPLAQLLTHLVFTKAAARVEVLSARGVQHCLVLDVFQVVLEVLCAVGVEEPDHVDVEELSDIIEGYFLVRSLDFEGFAIVAAAIVDEILNRSKDTIFSSAFL
jgi:hypothetical protein